jgi:hypothetical protein
MKFFTYRWLHIPTGTGGIKSETFVSRESFLSFLNSCNRSLPGHWQYWEA